MTTYMKNFIYAALVYLGLAAVFGILEGLTDIGYIGTFAHTHFNLLGFMAMSVFGIGYFILPRFNGTSLRFDSWVPVHFWLANISLVGMVLFRGLSVESGADVFSVLFIVAASIQVLSIFMFIVNIWITLTPKRIRPGGDEERSTTRQRPSPEGQSLQNIAVTSNTRVADLVDALPDLQQTLAEAGLIALRIPGHLEKVRQMRITIGMAAQNHGLNLENLIAKVKHRLREHGRTTHQEPGITRITSTITGTPPPDPDSMIGDVLKAYPNSRGVFQKYFGAGCFDCPGQWYESIDMACRMHGVDAESFLDELRQSLTQE